MKLYNTILSVFLTFFSIAVLAYISIATMIGPWIGPTIVIIAGFLLKIKSFRPFDAKNSSLYQKNIALMQTVGSSGGIIATALGFTLPTLYFFNKAQFDRFIENPLFFCSIIGLFCIASGGLGMLFGRAFSSKFLAQKDLSFPVSNLIHKTITSQTQEKQAKQMILGFSFSSLLCFMRDGISIRNFHIPPLFHSHTIHLFQSIFGKMVPISIMPMLAAIGFIAGMGIVLPLLVGMLSKYFVLFPLNIHSLYLPFKLFEIFDEKVFGMAFCSGLILAEVVPALLKYPSLIANSIKQSVGVFDQHSCYSYFKKISSTQTTSLPKHLFYTSWNFCKKFIANPSKIFFHCETFFSITTLLLLLWYFHFPLLSIIIILPLTLISAYHISYIGCKIGLVQIGRFTTFVMVPTIFFFKLTALQITLLCIFVSCCITITANLLFNYKLGKLCNISLKQIHHYQWLGIFITALGAGLFLWLLFTNLTLGSPQLFAQRGKVRALLLQSFNFDWLIILLGFLYGLILKKLNISPSMVLGGILMPNHLTIGLVLGAFGSILVKNKHYYFPLCSGIFAGESIWLIFNISSKLL